MDMLFGRVLQMNFSQLKSQLLAQQLERPHLNDKILPFSALPGGLPCGKLIEIRGPQGAGKTELLLKLFQENESLQIAWIECAANIYPCAFSERGVDLSRVLFIEASGPSEALWCAHQALKSQIFGALVLSQMDAKPQPQQVIPHNTIVRPRDSRSSESRGPNGRGEPQLARATCKSVVANDYKSLGEIELRRLQIAAEKSGSTVFLVNGKSISAESWPIEVQLEITRDLSSQPVIQILKSRRNLWTPQTVSELSSTPARSLG